MAKKKKKVSITAVDNVMKNTVNNSSNIVWNDIEISITHTISFTEMLAFVNDVTMSCFISDGGFVPEVMDFVIRTNVLTRYANFNLPDNIEHKYEIAYCTDAFDAVVSVINQNQLNEIIASSKKKIEHMCAANVNAIQAKMTELLSAFDGMQAQASSLFSNISAADISSMTEAISNNSLTEKKIIEEYIRHTKEDTDAFGDDE